MTHDSYHGHDAPAAEVLERYLAGECSSPERERVEVWITADPAHLAYVQSLRTLGEAWARARPRFDSQGAWQRLKERTATGTTPILMGPPARTPEVAQQASIPGQRRGRGWDVRLPVSSRGATARRWAAAVAAAAAAVIGVITIGPRHVAESMLIRPREYATAAGQRVAVTLPDGTRLRLAPQSRLVLDADYGRGTRTVRLVGQAYFEVTHDQAHPFLVQAGNTVAWDLGTKFTVRAYADEQLQVAVREGSVALPQALAAPLLPGDVAVVDSVGHGTVEHNAPLGRYTAWLNGALEFRNTPLAEVAADLSRWYGVDVVLGDRALAHRPLTVTVTESSIEAALELITPAVGARYERHGGIITLFASATP